VKRKSISGGRKKERKKERNKQTNRQTNRQTNKKEKQKHFLVSLITLHLSKLLSKTKL